MSETRKEYIVELNKLQERISQMGIAASEAVEKSMQALVEGNSSLGREVMAADDILDQMNIEIEDTCMLLIARQQPIARDLRIITTALKLSTDLERIGDHAFDIAKIATQIPQGRSIAGIKHMAKMANCAVDMLNKAVVAYRTTDLKLAEEVNRQDNELDKLFVGSFQEFENIGTSKREDINNLTNLAFIARYLERIGDHAVNIAEWVIYMETAQRVHS